MRKEISIITRADDCGSNHSANIGIQKAIEGGVLKNISIMATCPSVEEAARLFIQRTDICFGLHFVLNAEWDNVKWGPVSNPSEVPTLTEPNGLFNQHPRYFKGHQPRMEEVITELKAQMKRLTNLGFKITYVDTHMVPEWGILGLEDALRTWCYENGFLYWGDYYNHNLTMSVGEDPFAEHIYCLESLDAGQYLMITHPAIDSEEMRALGNSYETGIQIAMNRSKDILLWSHPNMLAEYNRRGIRPIRYDEAVITIPKLSLNKFWDE